MASEPKCDSETLFDDFEELVATEFDEDLIRELLEELPAEVEGSAEQVEQGIEVNGCDGSENIEHYANNVHEFDWSEMAPAAEPSDTICSVEDYTDEFAEFGNSGEYSHSYEESSLDETAYAGLW